MAMTVEQRELEIERLREIGARGRAAQRKKLGDEKYREHMASIGAKGAKSKWALPTEKSDQASTAQPKPKAARRRTRSKTQ